MYKLNLFINQYQQKKLFTAWKLKKQFCILRFNKDNVYNYNCSIDVEHWVYRLIHERIAKNIGIWLRFCPIEGKILKSDNLDDLLEVFEVY